MIEQEWLKNLKVGDEVVYNRSTLGGAMVKSIKKVLRMTKTLIILDNNTRFRKSDGITPGNSWYFSHISRPSIAAKAQIQEIEGYKDLDTIIHDSGIIKCRGNSVKFFRENKEVLEKIANILREHNEEVNSNQNSS